MVDYESMTRPELIDVIRALEAKVSQAGLWRETAGPDRDFALLEQERELLFERSSYAMLIHDRETRQFLKVNDAALRLYGYSREEFFGMKRDDIRAGDDIPTMSQIRRQREPTGYMHHLGLRTHRKKSSGPFEVELFAQDIIFDGRKARVTLIVDVTERTLAEGRLRQQKKLLDAIIENLPVGLSIKDAHSLKYLLRNRASEALTGYRHECIGKTSYELFPKDHAEELHKSDLRALATKAMVEIPEQKRCTKSGEVSVFHVRKFPVFDDAGQPQLVVSIYDDITRQKLTDKALRESEERFRLLAENFRDVFWIATPGLDKMLYVSPAFEEIWGMSLDDIYRDPLAWQRVIHPEDLPLVRETLERVRSGEDTAVEYRIVRPVGDVRWIWDRSYSMTTSDGTRLPCGIAEDITDRKRTESERLAREVAQRETLVKEVHHRIKNHLQGIVGLLRQKVKGNPAFAPLVESAVAELQSVAAAFGLRANLESGSAELKPMLEAIIASVQGVTGGRVSLAYGIDQREQVLVADSEKVPLALALNELSFNALKHSSERGRKKNARISVRKQSGSWRITVTNKGKLTPGFDFARGRGIGSGLDLVRSLLPPKDATLVISGDGERVTAVLTLKHPVIVVGEPASPRHHDEAEHVFAAMR